ncbi:MAG: hypothetical protein CMO19_01700 [Thaumarchaeota archaeon]|nr:hypothetical protein [Nitrososphaerota archaeon]|tara:strand:+ start:12394 stop:12819 length:426 start_codon:yes stop_codon:yes gene_type:complete
MNPLKTLSVSSALGIYVLIVVGGITTQSGSGMACPDWPLCFGQFLPNLSIHVLIEMTHRYLAMIVGFLILGTFIVAYRSYRNEKYLVATSGITLLLVTIQGYIGMLTVTSILDPAIVTIHLAVSTALFGFSIITALISFRT